MQEKTTQKKLEEMLFQRGIFEKQAHEIMEYAKPKLDGIIDNYNISWNRPADEYPESIYGTLFMFLRPIVAEWAEKNMLEAWWVPMFRDME